jgi:hypothetical protein
LPSAYLLSSGSDISVVNDHNVYDALSLNSYYRNNDFFIWMQTFLLDSTGTVFSSFVLPTNLNMASFGNSMFKLAFIRNSDGDQVQITGALSSTTISEVPVPSAIWLFGSSLVWFCGVLSSQARFGS